MSHDYYNELWLIARNDLEKLLELERKTQRVGPVRKREAALNLLLPTYLRYRNLVKRLVICYDQMVHAQKRQLIKRILDCAIGRLLQYKREIVKLESTDYVWPDDFMNRLKFTPDDVEIRAPAAGKELLTERRKYIQGLLDNVNKPPQAIRERSLSSMHIASLTDLEDSTSSERLHRSKRTKADSSKVQMSLETAEDRAAREARLATEKTLRSAIILLQSHERARKARNIGNRLQRMYDYNKKVMMGEIQPKKMDKARCRNAAIVIQRAWRRYAGRKSWKRRIEKIEETLGMTIPSWKPRDVFRSDEENFRRRLGQMPVFAARTEKAVSDERTRLLRIKGPGLMEDITDEIREWFLIWYNELGHFDVFPAAKLGGSVLIATGQTLTPQEYLAETRAKTKARKGGKESPETKTEGGKGGREKKEKIEEGFRWRMPTTEAFNRLDEYNREFIEHWSLRDESGNPGQREYLDLITEKLCHELQLEVREIVDELMRLELERLNAALLKDHADDEEKFTIPMSEKTKKKRKGGRKKKRGKRKDILGDVAVEEHFVELVQSRIIRNYPETSLRDWIGDLSYQNYEASCEFRDYKHRLGEIKQVIVDYCVLPLISKDVHKIAPLTKSICICGLPGNGKTFLVNAICTEVGALMFDMTPEVLAGKYHGRVNERRLMGMISRVARIYAPSVIYIDGGERPWLKKVPAEERFIQPRRFAKYYKKFVKDIKPGDQILFLTTSSEPYKAKRPFVKIHNKFITIPRTDYNTLYMFYKDLLMKYHGVDRNIDVSCLARQSVGIPLDFIKQAVQNVLNLRRRITLKFRPLMPQEIMEEVLKYEFPAKKTLKQFDKFEGRIPLVRRRRRMLAAEKAEREQKIGQKEKARKR